jgi:hypothetical protein
MDISMINRDSYEELAEREGFEPSKGFKTLTPLAGVRLRPLGHLSGLSTALQELPRLPGKGRDHTGAIPQRQSWSQRGPPRPCLGSKIR